jgi:hypothetical protein
MIMKIDCYLSVPLGTLRATKGNEMTILNSAIRADRLSEGDAVYVWRGQMETPMIVTGWSLSRTNPRGIRLDFEIIGVDADYTVTVDEAETFSPVNGN